MSLYTHWKNAQNDQARAIVERAMQQAGEPIPTEHAANPRRFDPANPNGRYQPISADKVVSRTSDHTVWFEYGTGRPVVKIDGAFYIDTMANHRYDGGLLW